MIQASLILAILIFLVGELFTNLIVFNYLKKKLITKNKDEKNETLFFINRSVFKGILERLVLFIGLHYGFQPILVMFGAIKLGTRFKETSGTAPEEEKISNDYFLVGNLTTVLIAMIYTVSHQKLLLLYHLYY